MSRNFSNVSTGEMDEVRGKPANVGYLYSIRQCVILVAHIGRVVTRHHENRLVADGSAPSPLKLDVQYCSLCRRMDHSCHWPYVPS